VRAPLHNKSARSYNFEEIVKILEEKHETV
jgi:hypothetical protein